ncbi:MAG: CaiB/BaiF CoA transferase family protein [bacterium]
MANFSPPQGCLSGLRVLDLSRVLAGPFCTQALGDLGAEVIKIESPGRGDDTRQWGPPWFQGESAYFLCCNRNKKSVTINLKTEDGRELIRRLMAQCDVVVENFKAGALNKYGLDHETMRTLQPRLIYCSITGYGQDGPYKHLPGYDFIMQAQCGMMSITGEAKGEPQKAGVAIADLMSGMYAAHAILAALYFREKTGTGQHIDIALFDAQISWLANVAMNYLVSGEPPQRYGNAHPNLVPYQVFVTASDFIAIGVGNDEQFRRLCEALGRSDLPRHPDYQSNPRRVTHRERLIQDLQTEFHKQPTTFWLEKMAQAQIPAAPINTVAQALHDPQTQFRGMVQNVRHASGEALPLLGPVPKFSHAPAEIRLPPPVLGQHTQEVLQNLLGCEEASISAWKERGII